MPMNCYREGLPGPITVFLFLLIITAGFQCSSDESWKDDLVGTGQVGVDAGVVNCADVEYGNWEESEYFLPYTIGESYMVGLGPCGGSFHGAGMPDQFAIDFNMPIGNQVRAARSGKVIFVEEEGQDGGFPNNMVVLQHSDDTFAMYMHLTNDGATVTVGESVPRGGLVGYSGNTGLAGYPHLHFVVVTRERWVFPYNSIPVTFKNTIPNERSLEQGVHYPAYPN